MNTNLYKKVYRKLNLQSPLKSDCGKLCDSACCKGDDGAGMLLFPHEDLFLQNKVTSFKIEDTKIVLKSNYRVKMLICDGTCDRNSRPLSCRIFPLSPLINKESSNNNIKSYNCNSNSGSGDSYSDGDILTLELDKRGINTCPLIKYPSTYLLYTKFIDSVYDIFRILMKDNDCLEFIYLLSNIQKDFKLIRL